MSDQFISVRETAQSLGVSEKKVMDLIEGGKLQAYKIAGQFLRLKQSEVLRLQTTGTVVEEVSQYKYSPAERLKDFFYFNDFYLASLAVIIILTYFILNI